MQYKITVFVFCPVCIPRLFWRHGNKKSRALSQEGLVTSSIDSTNYTWVGLSYGPRPYGGREECLEYVTGELTELGVSLSLSAYSVYVFHSLQLLHVAMGNQKVRVVRCIAHLCCLYC